MKPRCSVVLYFGVSNLQHPGMVLNVLRFKTLCCKDLLHLCSQQKVGVTALILLFGCRASGRLNDSW